MRMCPKCGEDSAVLDSRETDRSVVRRRRECRACATRWTTYELSAEEYEALQRVQQIAQTMATARRALKSAEEQLTVANK
jgi:transcriptional regulator NrdR family protein